MLAVSESGRRRRLGHGRLRRARRLRGGARGARGRRRRGCGPTGSPTRRPSRSACPAAAPSTSSSTRIDPATIDPLAKAIEEERPVARVVPVSGPNAGAERLVFADDEVSDEIGRTAQELLAAGETALVQVGDDEVFVDSFAPRPNMYVFGAVDHAAAVAEIGRFLGYRVTVCDARAKFVTPERFPEVGRARRRVARPLPRALAGGRAHGDLRAHPRPQVRRPRAEGRARDERRLHRRDGQQADDRAAGRAPARRGRLRRGAHAHPRADRASDRLAHPAGGRRRGRGPARSRSCARRRRAAPRR